MDRYDRAISMLTKVHDWDRPTFVAYVDVVWHRPNEFLEGCLFAFLGTDPMSTQCGYPSQHKTDNPIYPCKSNLAHDLIMEDSLIPKNISEITLEGLQSFAEVQRTAD